MCWQCLQTHAAYPSKKKGNSFSTGPPPVATATEEVGLSAPPAGMHACWPRCDGWEPWDWPEATRCSSPGTTLPLDDDDILDGSCGSCEYPCECCDEPGSRRSCGYPPREEEAGSSSDLGSCRCIDSDESRLPPWDIPAVSPVATALVASRFGSLLRRCIGGSSNPLSPTMGLVSTLDSYRSMAGSSSSIGSSFRFERCWLVALWPLLLAWPCCEDILPSCPCCCCCDGCCPVLISDCIIPVW
mmetsp:Transcript_27616/g.66507  ORF Transcript_27616/g.66507 Transcript_27616/m.66507 type:complete len:243 (+) Transcript_27616:2826-3554(+)